MKQTRKVTADSSPKSLEKRNKLDAPKTLASMRRHFKGAPSNRNPPKRFSPPDAGPERVGPEIVQGFYVPPIVLNQQLTLEDAHCPPLKTLV